MTIWQEYQNSTSKHWWEMEIKREKICGYKCAASFANRVFKVRESIFASLWTFCSTFFLPSEKNWQNTVSYRPPLLNGPRSWEEKEEEIMEAMVERVSYNVYKIFPLSFSTRSWEEYSLINKIFNQRKTLSQNVSLKKFSQVYHCNHIQICLLLMNLKLFSKSIKISSLLHTYSEKLCTRVKQAKNMNQEWKRKKTS